MSHDVAKLIAVGAVLVVLIVRFATRLRGLAPEARALEIRKGFGSLLAIAAMAGLFVYLLATTR